MPPPSRAGRELVSLHRSAPVRPTAPAVGHRGHASGQPDTERTDTSRTTRKPCAAAWRGLSA